MTTKRFNRVGGYVYDGDKCISHFEDVAHRDDIVKLLNELHEENQDLKSFNQDLAENLSVCANARISKDNRIKRLEEKIQRERISFTKTHERWSKEAETKIKELQNENKQLKTKNFAYLQDIEVFKEENTHLKLENEQLKQFQDRVFSWIDMHLQRLPTLRDDEFESDNEFSDPSLYSGAIQILETMKKELKGDVE